MLYTLPLTPSSTTSLFKNDMLGKYAPIAASTAHIAQNSKLSFSSSTAPDRHALATSVTAMSTNVVLSRVCVGVESEKKADPAIMAHMKLEKMRPYGSSSSEPERARALLSAADQKKMNRYMAPSKKQDVIPSARICLLPMIVESALLMSPSEVRFTDLAP